MAAAALDLFSASEEPDGGAPRSVSGKCPVGGAGSGDRAVEGAGSGDSAVNGAGSGRRSDSLGAADSLRKLQAVVDLLDELCQEKVSDLSGAELLQFSELLASVRARTDALHSTTLVRVKDTGDFRSTGSRTLAEFERKISRTSLANSRTTVKRAEALHDHLADFNADLQQGKISTGHIDVLTRATQDPQLKEKLLDPEDGAAQLLVAARSMDAGRFTKRVRAWATKHAPSRAEREAQAQFEEQTLAFVETEGGWKIKGQLDSLNGQIVNNVLTSAMGVPTAGDPRGPLERRAAALVEICQRVAQDKDVASLGNGAAHITVQIPFDTLVTAEARAKIASRSASVQGTAAQDRESGATGGYGVVRGHGAVDRSGRASDGRASDGRASGVQVVGGEVIGGEVIGGEVAGRHGGAGELTGGEVTSSAHPDPETLGCVIAEIRAGIDPDLFAGLEPATLDDGTPLVPSQLLTLLCGSRLSRQIFTPDGIVLDHGQATRLCTNGQRRAVIARDGTCRFPGCDHTHQASEIHHAIPWHQGGPTDIGNLIMLCWYHHQFVHQNDITIYRHENGVSFRDDAGYWYTERGRERR
ncbi:HNH endonuclease signature motif containing protein [Trueperella bialowiezensis]|uniref:HNH endonuclease n=1 Tax=Trueperella bialowiezensis TaxID=312285 RepID=A0A3S4UYH4_9ACTO|nr:HNH endonuclease signature motif containing protein [Trueperella bialowiezensis]VEI12978.1 HNH endonuclease [Trueperella bialowiezensis]